MRVALILVLLAASILMPALAVAGGIALNTGVRFEFTDCAVGGSASQAVTEGTYLMRVTDADTFVCYAATCAAAGEKFPAGTVVLLTVGRAGQTMSCRSSASTGDVILTLASGS